VRGYQDTYNKQIMKNYKMLLDPIISFFSKKSKKKIKIHRYENKLWGRAHLPFFKKMDIYLSIFFDIEVINYNKDGNTFSGPINLIKNYSNFGNNPPLSDVDYVIENCDTGQIKMFSFTEYFNSYVSHLAKSENCDKVLLAHFNWHNIYYWMLRENAINHMHKILPYIFLPFEDFNVDYYRKRREEVYDKELKMFWLGSGVDSYRKMIRVIEKKEYLQPIISTSHSEYLDKLTNSKIAISYYLDLNKYNTPYDHIGEFCYRDIEYLLCGVPFIRVEYKDQLIDQLLPNYHYISIPREHAYLAYEKYGDEGVADLYISKYKEVINNDDFLNYISKNQIEWADRNLMSNNKEKLTFELLELHKWV
jgi:hypothetical protein